MRTKLVVLLLAVVIIGSAAYAYVSYDQWGTFVMNPKIISGEGETKYVGYKEVLVKPGTVIQTEFRWFDDENNKEKQAPSTINYSVSCTDKTGQVLTKMDEDGFKWKALKPGIVWLYYLAYDDEWAVDRRTRIVVVADHSAD